MKFKRSLFLCSKCGSECSYLYAHNLCVVCYHVSRRPVREKVLS